MTYKFSTPTEYETEIARLVRRFHFETKGKNKIKKDAYLIINEYNRFLEDPDGLDLEEEYRKESSYALVRRVLVPILVNANPAEYVQEVARFKVRGEEWWGRYVTTVSVQAALPQQYQRKWRGTYSKARKLVKDLFPKREDADSVEVRLLWTPNRERLEETLEQDLSPTVVLKNGNELYRIGTFDVSGRSYGRNEFRTRSKTEIVPSEFYEEGGRVTVHEI